MVYKMKEPAILFVPNSTSILPANANFMFRIGVKNVCGSDPTLTFQCFSEFA